MNLVTPSFIKITNIQKPWTAMPDGFFDQPWGIQWRKALVSAPRLVPDAVMRYTSPEGPHPFVIKIPSRGKHSIPVYVFVPESKRVQKLDEAPIELPVVVDFHGGGFVLGSCEYMIWLVIASNKHDLLGQEQAPFCAMLARSLPAVVLSVDYRMGPMAKFPSAIHDAEDIISAVLDPSSPGYAPLREALTYAPIEKARPPVSISPLHLAISGFSSGSNLALNLAISLAKTDTLSTPWPSVIPLEYPNNIPLLLFYPSLDCRQLPSERPLPPSMQKLKLQEKPPQWYKSILKSMNLESELQPTYLPRDMTAHHRASPGLASLINGGLHPKATMLLVLPEMDTLAEQSATWIRKVEHEGLSDRLTVRRVPGVVHGWTQFPDSWLDDAARKAKTDVFDEARRFARDAWYAKKHATSKTHAPSTAGVDTKMSDDTSKASTEHADTGAKFA